MLETVLLPEKIKLINYNVLSVFINNRSGIYSKFQVSIIIALTISTRDLSLSQNKIFKLSEDNIIVLLLVKNISYIHNIHK